MSTLPSRTVLVGCSLLVACGPATVDAPELASDSAALTQGYKTNTHPDVGLVTYQDLRCTGTLVGPRTVLTAAHCTKYRSTETPGDYGTFTIDQPTGPNYNQIRKYTYHITRFATLAKSQADIPVRDLAVLQLNANVSSVVAKPYTLATSYAKAHAFSAIYGYGCTYRPVAGGPQPTSTEGPDGVVNPALACTSDFIKRRYDFSYGPTHVCSGGDSGGPQMSGAVGIMGVVSEYDSSGEDRFGNAVAFHSWIVAQMNRYR